MNPITARELRERFRRTGSLVFVTLWLLVIGLFGYFAYLLARVAVGATGLIGGFAPLLASASMGRFMLQLFLLLLLTAVIFVAPGLSALSIVGERERQTFPLVQVSQLGAYQIVLGKLGSSLAYLLLLLVAAAPLLVLPALFGGVTVGDVLGGLAAVVGTAATLGALGLWMSSVARSSRGAVASSYVWAFSLGLGTFLLLTAELLLVGQGPADPFDPRGRELYSAWLNPFMAMVSAVEDPPGAQTLGTPGPFLPFQFLVQARQGDPQSMGQLVDDQPVRRGPLWIRSLALAALLSALALSRAARAVRAPRRRRPVLRRRRRAPVGSGP
jgi:ABC-2 type transport system permease protein